MNLEANCPLCGLKTQFDPTADIIEYQCRRCMHVSMTRELYKEIEQPDYIDKRYILSGVSRYWRDYKITPITFSTKNVNEMINLYFVPKNILQKIATLIKFFAEYSDYAGDTIEFQIFYDYPVAFCYKPEEFEFLLNYLETNGIINRPYAGATYILTIYGWGKYEEIQKVTTESNQAFVAMWFDESMDDIYDNYISKALKKCNYDIMRIDLKQHNNKIDDEIIAEIRKSKFMIADFTGQRGGAYFEAGFAMGLGIPVIWTCKKTDLANCHFDTRQFNYIAWDNGDDLYKRLVDRINASII